MSQWKSCPKAVTVPIPMTGEKVLQHGIPVVLRLYLFILSNSKVAVNSAFSMFDTILISRTLGIFII